ncbi:hypothetical protein Tco_1163220 [Tanacetum coccineum]
MVNTINTPATLDDGVRQWVTDHVDSVTLGINEKLDNMLLQFNYLVTDVNRLKGGEGSSRFSRMSKLEFPKFYGEDKYTVIPVNIVMFNCWFGPPATIEFNVRMFKPKSLSDAFSLANLQEATLVVIKQRNTPILPTPRSASTWNVNKNTSYSPKSTTTTLALPAPNTQIIHKYYANETTIPKKLLSQKEFVDKRAKNLCFYCYKKYVPSHKCEGHMFALKIKGIEGEECLEEEEEEFDMISYELSEQTP